MEQRPGIAYRRPGGDASRFVVEAAGDPRLDLPERPDGGWLGCVADEDRGRLRAALEVDPVDVVYRVESGAGSRWIHERGREVDDGDVVGYLFPADERVERRRRLERQRERLEEFASVVSHDLRNPLSVAVGNIELAADLDADLDGDGTTERLDRALDALDRMDDLIGDLLTLAREGETVRAAEPTELRSVVERAWRTVGEPADAALVVDGPLGEVSCDPDRLRQAFENLFRNALEHGTPDSVDALSGPAEGTPEDDIESGTFSTGGEASAENGATGAPDAFDTPDASDLPDAAVRVRVGPTDDGFYVADDGPGIEVDQRDAVFEPGHTTAPDGTGFGLAIVERIAGAHGWAVSVTESREGGARFEFACDESLDAGESAESEPNPTHSA
ncbi:sensor histidine kinase [Halorubrum hochstenium]|uniref:histidine kinase n=1 Tax=Halorubrum hochstenium ATCC 700873 TaxID=1227481 RepID=M0FD71_9EURY|nr:histidine kinase [Halorubrum hochstenium ATCC 700873]